MRITISLLLLIVVAIACNKDKFQTKPTLTIKSTSGNYVPANAGYQVTLECTDKEGDVQDSIWVVKNRLNKRIVTTVRDTLGYKFPIFPSKQTTEILISLSNQDIISALNPPTIPGSNPPQKELDTLILKFVVKDNAGNKSDTVMTETIHVFRQ